MDLDYQNYDPSKGWPLSEAMERTVDPETWANWNLALQKYREHKILTDGYRSEIKESEEEHERLRRQAEEASLVPSREFWSHLINERLSATGSRGSVSEQPTSIFAAGWERIAAANWDTSTARETVPPHTMLYNVRVYPLVHGPDAAKRIIGSSFARAFRRYVLEDPEVVARGKEVIKDHGHELVFREGQMPGLSVRYQWPVELTVVSLASDFSHPGLIILDAPLPGPSEAISHAATVLVDRWRALIRLVSSGSVLARGTFVQTGEIRAIDPLQWERSNVWVEVRNGDFMEPDASGKLTVRWSGISLVAPAALQSAPAMREVVKPPGRTRRRPKTEAVEIALAEAGIDLRSTNLSHKAVASLIAPFLAGAPETAEQLDALTKIIGRLRKAASA